MQSYSYSWLTLISFLYFNTESKIDDISLLNGGYIAIGERKGTLTVGVLGGDNQLEVKLSCVCIRLVSQLWL